jgi:hypothetical protein
MSAFRGTVAKARAADSGEVVAVPLIGIRIRLRHMLMIATLSL